MNRPTATALLSAAALAALTACQGQDPTTVRPAPAGTSQATTCSPVFDDGIDGSGITRSGGTLTATVSLDCGDQDPPDPTTVALALFYRPAAGTGTTPLGQISPTTYQDFYTSSAPCRAGLYYIGVTVNGTPARGTQIDVTTCS